jgi:beta-glucosidase
MFDPDEMVPYAQIPSAKVDAPEHAALALQAARDSLVLLKNNGALPLDRSRIRRLAVIGANADSVPVLLGNYNGTPSRPVTILKGIRTATEKAGLEIAYARGCPLVLKSGETFGVESAEFQQVLDAVRAADAIVYVGGISPQLEGEEMKVDYDGFRGGDRTRIELPAVQAALLKVLHATGKPVVFVNCSGSAVAMPWEAEHLAAIVQAWYPGQAGGTAVAELLFGDSNPSGRLPVTFYRATEDLPPFEDYRMANRTHRFFTGQPLFPFGHGLSYTRFRYDQARLGYAEIGIDDTIRLSLDLVNAGERDGDEVVQVYARRLEVDDPQLPRHTLCAFRRVAVPKGQRATVELTVPAKTLRHWDPPAQNYVVDAGTYELQIGASSEDIRTTVQVRIKAR